MRQAIFAGSFDPLTTGHLWMIREGARLFDTLHVLVAVNPEKKAMFTPAERRHIIERTVDQAGIGNVRVDATSSEFIAQVATRKGVDYLVRGLRSTADFDHEDLLRQTNEELFAGPQTVFLIPPKGLSSVSSSFVKALLGPVGWPYAVEGFLPPESRTALLRAVLSTRWSRLLQRFSVAPERAEVLFRAWIEPAYGHARRHYHTYAHLAHSLSEVDALADNGESLSSETRAILECAIFFHDLVYRGEPFPPQDGEGDEGASARLAADFLARECAAPNPFVASVVRTILATRHAVEACEAPDPWEACIRDIDLSILGRPEKEYARYQASVRQEFSDVPLKAYITGRCAILQSFLEKAQQKQLFTTPWFCQRGYNQRAQRNLALEIKAWQG